jgi:sugar fermentation stimulation protein A
LVRCETEGAGVVEAFLPNPGRLWELLVPGSQLYLTSHAHRNESQTTSGIPRKTRHTVLAVDRDGSPVFLHTHLTNTVARWLIEHNRITELAGATVVRAEIPVGHSRFDFLLRRARQKLLLEVKSCTLFGNGVAMFPDAVTERGRRHLLELAALRHRGVRPVVLFLVHSPQVQWFMPDYHTDFAFSQTFLKLRDSLAILPVALEWTPALELGPTVRRLNIPWDYLKREVADRGSYLLLLRLDRPTRIRVGQLGEFEFARGYHVYVGSAMQSLSGRLAWHAKQRKKLHWHVDYLRQVANGVVALPIRSSMRDECQLARALSAVLRSGPAGFGASDCNCPTHLFESPTNPLSSPAFHAVLQQFRMRAPI